MKHIDIEQQSRSSYQSIPPVKELDDVSSLMKSNLTSRGLDESGMDEIAVPINIDLGELGHQTQFADAKATVNTIDGATKGIHMSRLYLHLTRSLESEPLSTMLIEDILSDFKESHGEISSCSSLTLRFNWPIKRPSLTTGLAGWRLYPITLKSHANEHGVFTHRLSVEITYGSFCPCSASLARQAIQETFQKDFEDKAQPTKDDFMRWLGKESSISAIPHGQRSTAELSFDLNMGKELNIPHLIDYLESAIKTPVQTAVKRPDEQEFARICGTNLMFVEDAAKIFHKALLDYPKIDQIKVSVAHHESLHAHDAVATIDDTISKQYQ
ncbi:MAG: GTP cyclohydrolase I FolE2 [Pseudobacteriovorax sp.]|nr:GTP cyclohydrolase I FolE2 [Pseudobacteriovorax sp.]